MAVTSPASMGKIKTEFGGGAGAKLTDYYRGGARVPNIPANNAIPASGQIRVTQFIGATNASIAKSGDATGSVFLQEPAPQNTTVYSNTVTITGAGLSSCTWSYVSGDVVTVSAGSASASFSDSVNKNGSRSSVYRATGNNGLTIDVTVSLDYMTDI